MKKFMSGLVFLSALGSAMAQTPAANHLVLSEIGAASPGSAEFTEIYNPTGSAVNLSNYFVTDHNQYFDLPSYVSKQLSNTLNNTSDHLVRLPNISIPSGGVVVVCYQATSFLEVYFDGDLSKFTSLPGNPQLVEVNESRADVINVSANYNRQSPNYVLDDPGTPVTGGNNLNHTDTDENTVLFYWDGNSSLVKDLDIVQWRAYRNPWGASSNQTANKSSVSEMGPSGILETYGTDAGGSDNLTVNFPEASEGEVDSGVFIRQTLLEPGETHTGGNGLTGDDESMEKVNLSWKIAWGASSNASPGLVDFGLSSQNQAPVVGVATRNIQFPTPGATVHITCPVYDEGTPTVRLMVAKGNNTFAATTMTNEGGGVFGADISTAGLADGTLIRYYVTATDSGNLTAREQDQTFRRQAWPGHHIFSVKTGAYDPNSIIVSEVMYNPQGSNNYTQSQYFELYNPATTELDISGYVVKTNYRDVSSTDVVLLPENIIVIPDGTKIPAKGYVVVAGAKDVFHVRYPGIDLSRVVDVDIEPAKSFIAHAGSTIYFFGPNNFDYDYLPVDNSAAFKTFAYQNNTNGWPQGATGVTPPTNSAGDTGYSIELKSLVPGSENTGSNWAISKFYQGSPMANNSVDTTLRPGDVTLTQPTRSEVNPTPSSTIQFQTNITSTNAISEAKLWYSINNGPYASVPMTLVSGNTYSGSLSSLPDNSLIKYYVEGTDTSGNKGTYPVIAPVAILPFWVNSVSPISNIKVNEIMYNPAGTDNMNYPEFIELYNAGSTPIDLSFYMIGVQLRVGATSARTMPEGTILPANGYFVLASRKSHFVKNYLSPFKSVTRTLYGEISDNNNIAGCSWTWGTSILVNGGTTLRLLHPNQIDYSGTVDGTPFLSVTYTTASPWPGAGGTKSIEIINPGSDPNVGTSYLFSKPYNGTPLARNSVSPPLTAINDWNLY